MKKGFTDVKNTATTSRTRRSPKSSKRTMVAPEIAGACHVERAELERVVGPTAVEVLHRLWENPANPRRWSRDPATGRCTVTNEYIAAQLGVSVRTVEEAVKRLRAVGLIEQPDQLRQGTKRPDGTGLTGAGGLGFQMLRDKEGKPKMSGGKPIFVFVRRVLGAPARGKSTEVRVPEHVAAALAAAPSYGAGRGRGGGGQVENLLGAGTSGATRQRRIRRRVEAARAGKTPPTNRASQEIAPDLAVVGSRPSRDRLTPSAPDLAVGLDPSLSAQVLSALQDLRSGGDVPSPQGFTLSGEVGEAAPVATSTSTAPTLISTTPAPNAPATHLGESMGGTGRPAPMSDSMRRLLDDQVKFPGAGVAFKRTPTAPAITIESVLTPRPPKLPDGCSLDVAVAILVRTYRDVVEAELGVACHLDHRTLGREERRRLHLAALMLMGRDPMCPDAEPTEAQIAPAAFILWQVRAWMAEHGNTRAPLRFVFGAADADGAVRLHRAFGASGYSSQVGREIVANPKQREALAVYRRLRAGTYRTEHELAEAVEASGYHDLIEEASEWARRTQRDLDERAAAGEWVWGGKVAPRKPKVVVPLPLDTSDREADRWSSRVRRGAEVMA